MEVRFGAEPELSFHGCEFAWMIVRDRLKVVSHSNCSGAVARHGTLAMDEAWFDYHSSFDFDLTNVLAAAEQPILEDNC